MLTNQQLGFAHDCLTMNQSDAYRANYDVSGMMTKSIWEKSSELAANVKVASMIDDLRSKLANKKEWSTERWLEEAEINLSQAREYKQMGPAVSQLTKIGQATGVLKEDTASNDTPIDAILGVAKALSEAHLRGLAESKIIDV